MSDMHKLAALRLNSLDDDDKNWILSRLPVTEQEKINKEIQVFGELDIESSEELVAEFIGKTGINSVINDQKKVKSLRTESPKYRRINNAKLTDIKALLEGIPEELVSAILSERSWQWEEEYLISCGSSRKNRLKTLKNSSHQKLGSRAKAVLIECFSDELISTDDSEDFDNYLESASSGNKKGVFSRWRKK